MKSETPPPLSPGAASVGDIGGTWIILRVKHRHEKSLACELRDRGAGYYLPLDRQERLWAGKKRWVFLPYFYEYVFATYRDMDEWWFLRDHPSVFGRVQIAAEAQRAFVRDLGIVERAINTGMRVEIYPELVPGRAATIRAPHKLAGIEGSIIRREGNTKIVLCIPMLGDAPQYDFEPCWLDPVLA